MQPTPATTRFFEIPELVSHLAHHHLDHESISRLMRTSRHMHVFCTPTLYYNVSACYKPRRRNLFASKESIDALARNVRFVRDLEMHMMDMVFYSNGVFASQDQPSTLTPPAPADKTSPSGEQKVRTIVSQRPRWLALPDSQICTVHPIPPMTLLTKLDLNLDFSVASKERPYFMPPYMDPRATLTQACWLLDLNSHLLELSLNDVLMKDHRDIRLLSRALFGLKQLQRANFDFVYRMGMRDELGESAGTETQGLILPVIFACPPALRTLCVETAWEEDILWEHGYWSDADMDEYLTLGLGQPLSWEVGHDDNEEDNELATTTAVARLRQEPMVHLRNLQLCYSREDGLSAAKLRSILAHCPNLTSIVVPPVHSIQHPQQFAQEIAQHLCPKLTNVKKSLSTATMRAGNLYSGS